MRVLLCLFAACFAGAALAAEERGVARPGGAFATLQAADSAACMRLCDDDGLCMAWTFRPDGLCELKAVVPPAVAQLGAVSGVSGRAPGFVQAAAAPAIAPAPPEQTPVDLGEPVKDFAANDPDDVLLGGLNGGGRSLRPRMGGAR